MARANKGPLIYLSLIACALSMTGYFLFPAWRNAIFWGWLATVILVVPLVATFFDKDKN